MAGLLVEAWRLWQRAVAFFPGRHPRFGTMPDLTSRALARCEYDETTSVLTVWFAETGKAWDHFAVPRSVYEALVAHEAPGRYFAEAIRDRYPAKQRRTANGASLAEALRLSL